MLNRICKISLVASLAQVPFLAGAQQLGQTKNFFETAQSIVTTTLIPLAFALALLFFFWGVAMYIWKAGSEKEEGRKIMIWGIIALFVMASVWGLVRFIQGELLPGGSPDSVPVPTIGGGGNGGNTFGTN